MPIAINAMSSVVQTFPVTTGALPGTSFAVPSRTRESSANVVVSFPVADPGVCSFAVQGSLDDVNYVTINTLAGTNQTPLSLVISPCPWKFLKVNQVTKTNGVTVSVAAVLV